MIHFQSICEVPNSRSALVGMRDNDNFVTPVDQLRGELVYVTFDSTRLGKEEVTDHSNAIRHPGSELMLSELLIFNIEQALLVSTRVFRF